MESHTYDHVAQRDFHIEKLATSLSRFLCLTNEWLASHKSGVETLDLKNLQQTARLIRDMMQMRFELDGLKPPPSGNGKIGRNGSGANGNNGSSSLSSSSAAPGKNGTNGPTPAPARRRPDRPRRQYAMLPINPAGSV